MSNQEKGEHSRGNEPNDDEKPLKKARYVWEVKGKYHLKDTYKNNNNSVNKNNNTDASVGESSEGSVEDKSEHKKKDEGEIKRAKKQKESFYSPNKCCIESFLAKTEAIIMDSDADDDDIPINNIEYNILKDVPATLVSPLPKNQDYYLRKWQARQIARGFVDNTINSVLETWINPPFDPVDFVEFCDNDGQVEDDAIRMAIQSHGLQSNSRGSVQLSNTAEQEKELIAFIRNPQIDESTLDNFENYQNELIKEQENISNSSTADSMSCDSSISNQVVEGELELGDSIDFLNAAVSVAIQKKGLSYGY